MINKRIKLVIKSSDNKKIDTVKFSKEESNKIRTVARQSNMSQDQLLKYAFDRFLADLKSGKKVW